MSSAKPHWEPVRRVVYSALMPHFLRLSAIFLGVMFAVSELAIAQDDAASKKTTEELPKAVKDVLRTQALMDKGFDKPAGTKLRFSRIEDRLVKGETFTSYRVYVVGAPVDMPLILAYWKIGAAPSEIQILSSNAYVNRKGLLLATKPGEELMDRDTAEEKDELRVALGKMAKGEPARFVVRSKDSLTMIAGTLVKHPLESESKGCKLSALISAPEANAILVYGDGFASSSNLIMKSISAEEAREIHVHTDSHGHSATVELPYVVGKEAGVVTESIATPECSVSISIPWGKGSYKPY